MRDVGLGLKDVLDGLKSPLGNVGKLADFARRHLPGRDGAHVPITHPEIRDLAKLVEDLTGTFGHTVEGQLMRHREEILEHQYAQARIADAATELFTMAAVVARLDAMLGSAAPETEKNRDLQVGRYYCHLAARRFRQHLHELGDNLDGETTAVADLLTT
jgi:hypothetical protein